MRGRGVEATRVNSRCHQRAAPLPVTCRVLYPGGPLGPAGCPGASSAAMAGTGLPIRRYRRALVEAVRERPFLIVTGETGSGKSTQLPKYLLEAGNGGGDRGDEPSAAQTVVLSPRGAGPCACGERRRLERNFQLKPCVRVYMV